MTKNEQEYWSIHEYRYTFLQNQILNLQLPAECKVLDVGCYPPFLFNFMVEHGFNAYGIASSHEQIVSDQVKVINIEKESFPWKENSFDLAIFTEVIEHLPHNPLIPLKEIYRKMKPGGYLLITTPNAAKLHHRLKLLFGKSTSFPIEQLMTVNPDDGSLYHLHHREYTLAELRKLTELSGFEVVDAQYVCLYPPTRQKSAKESLPLKAIKWLGFAAQQLVPPFRDSLFVCVRKS
jgi:2-polyprenyl-3-methyl-5-hydroxy-6-metoxy-1,4-benzoquinol methylase